MLDGRVPGSVGWRARGIRGGTVLQLPIRAKVDKCASTRAPGLLAPSLRGSLPTPLNLAAMLLGMPRLLHRILCCPAAGIDRPPSVPTAPRCCSPGSSGFLVAPRLMRLLHASLRPPAYCSTAPASPSNVARSPSCNSSVSLCLRLALLHLRPPSVSRSSYCPAARVATARTSRHLAALLS